MCFPHKSAVFSLPDYFLLFMIILVNFFTIFSLPVFALTFFSLWDIFILEMITKAECS